MMLRTIACLAALLFFGCQAGPDQEAIYLLTYNVAGLPQGISGSNPATNIPLISPMLNAFDLVIVQEDFYYQDQLRAGITLPHKSDPQRQGNPSGFGDGLNRFSRFPWRDFARFPFTGCDGADCMAHKGTSVALTQLAQGVEVDIYNLHLEAGSGAKDNAARVSHINTLLGAINSRSIGRALLVAGDFNLHRKDGGHDVEMLERLRKEGGLTQACDALNCGDDRVDRVFFRDSEDLTWTPLERTIEKRFVDQKGVDLSDHEALSAKLEWRLK